MYVKQRKDKEHLRCETCLQWKDDNFCDWNTFSNMDLVICSKCGLREANRAEKKLIKVRNPKVVYHKTKLGRKDGDKSNKSSKTNKQNTMF